MNVKIVKSTLTGKKGENLQPKICENLPRGVDATVLEYANDYAIVKLAWSNHPLIQNADDKELETLLTHPSILEELKAHPESEKNLITHVFQGSFVEEKTKKVIRVRGKEGSFIRKQQGKYGEEYVLDEG